MYNVYDKIIQKRLRCFALKMLAEWKEYKVTVTATKYWKTVLNPYKATGLHVSHSGNNSKGNKKQCRRDRGKEECSLMSVGEYFIWLSTLGSVAFWKNTQANGIKVHPELAYSTVTLNYQQIRRLLSVSLSGSLSSLRTPHNHYLIAIVFSWKPPKSWLLLLQQSQELWAHISVTFKPNIHHYRR